MNVPFAFDPNDVEALVASVIWPLCRIAGVLAVLPGIGGAEVPVRVRVGLAVALALLLAPTLPPVPDVAPLSAAGVLITAREILTGLVGGFVLVIAFNAVTLAGESIAVTMGLGFALMNDPRNGVQVPTVSQFYLLMATLLFFALDGHHAVLALLANSFTALPVGAGLGDDALPALLRFAATMFAGALGVALPALAAMLATNIAMGVVTRAAPQLNLFSVGFPVTMLVGFLALLLTLPAFAEAVEALFADAMATLATLYGS